MKHPTETKVIAGTSGAVGGGAAVPFVVWLLGVTVWGADSAAAHADDAVRAVPWPVSGMVLILVPGVLAFLGGRLAKHTPREPGPDAQQEWLDHGRFQEGEA